MSNLADFLLARYADEEAVARACETPGPWHVGPVDSVTSDVAVAEVYGPEGADDEVAENVYATDAEHIALHDPARVLAECEAKRRIVEIATDQIRLSAREKWDNWRDMATQTLSALALPYADHPDYREEWRLG